MVKSVVPYGLITPFGRRDAFVSEEVVLEIVHDY